MKLFTPHDPTHLEGRALSRPGRDDPAVESSLNDGYDPHTTSPEYCRDTGRRVRAVHHPSVVEPGHVGQLPYAGIKPGSISSRNHLGEVLALDAAEAPASIHADRCRSRSDPSYLGPCLDDAKRALPRTRPVAGEPHGGGRREVLVEQEPGGSGVEVIGHPWYPHLPAAVGAGRLPPPAGPVRSRLCLSRAG